MAVSQDDAEIIKRRTKAMQLRTAGYSYREIAEKLGYADASGARKAVLAALHDVESDSADDLRAQQQETLNMMKRPLTPKILKGDLKAMETMLRVMQREAKLHGLDKPEKLAWTDANGNDVEQLGLDEILRRMVAVASTSAAAGTPETTDHGEGVSGDVSA